MTRSASCDHLATMRSACHCACEEGRTISKQRSFSTNNLCDLNISEKVKEDNNNHNNNTSKCSKHGKFSRDYVNCDPSLHSAAFNRLMSLLLLHGSGSNHSVVRGQVTSGVHLSKGKTRHILCVLLSSGSSRSSYLQSSTGAPKILRLVWFSGCLGKLVGRRGFLLMIKCIFMVLNNVLTVTIHVMCKMCNVSPSFERRGNRKCWPVEYEHWRPLAAERTKTLQL